MKYDKHSIDYQVNIVAMEEMEWIVPMTLKERNALRGWVKSGHELESNPWHYSDSEGFPLNYLHAFRLKHGYSSGPWDYWRGGPDTLLWDDVTKSYRTLEELW